MLNHQMHLDHDVFGEAGVAHLSPAQLLVGKLVQQNVDPKFIIGHVSRDVFKLEVVCPEYHHRRAQSLADDIVLVSGPDGDAVGRKAKFTFAGASFPTGFEVLS